MPDFKGAFATVKLDVKSYIAVLDAVMQVVLEESARSWVEAATGRVPIWSGMARASLLPISELANTTIVISPLVAKSRIPKGRSLGFASLVARYPEYRIKIITEVEHYVIQDDFRSSRNGSPSAPWKSFEAGNEAFKNTIRTVPVPPVSFETGTVRKVK